MTTVECEACEKVRTILVFLSFLLTLGVGAIGIWGYAATITLRVELLENRSEHNKQAEAIQRKIDEIRNKECE